MDLASAIASTSGGSLNLAQGEIGEKDGTYFATVNGSQIACTWVDTITVDAGDKVLVAIQQPKIGTGTAIVLGRLTATPRPLYATVVSSTISSSTIKVQSASGEEFQAVWLGDSPPSIGAIVALLWQGSTPIILGKRRVSASEADDDVDTLKPIEPPKPEVKEVYVKAVDSATWASSFYWNQPGKEVVCGRWASYPSNIGLWFYGAGVKKLSDCTSLKIYIGARSRCKGWYNSSARVVFDLHGHSSRPGHPTAKGYSHTWVCPKGWSGGWVDLPGSWCKTLSQGGGIVIKGGDYTGFAGVGSSAKSGQLYGK